MSGPPAGREWRSTYLQLGNPFGPRSLHPTSPTAPGAPLPVDRKSVEKGGGETAVSLGTTVCLPGKAAEYVPAACSGAGPAAAENAPLSGCGFCRVKTRTCVAPLGPPLAAVLASF